MDKVLAALHVFFEEPFWVGVWERTIDGKLSVCKITFGSEPKNQDVYAFIVKNYDQLQFSPSVLSPVKQGKRNPKRVLREVRKQCNGSGAIGTKSQQALKLQQEQIKMVGKKKRKEQKDAEKQRNFELKQKKKKEKHRGR